ncbi:hypothetical protein [Hadaka virus 1]|uniref:Uncharacterized protein n=1 Tax=Hadaka virus 1 TaxID=2703488 RepID=A0A6J4BJQ1_9VIRU|nr:hypothetical protein QK729_s4gp1 [Hadaka virus 1]BBU94041.1 hypothetical protein [Hadaka virus 1]
MFNRRQNANQKPRVRGGKQISPDAIAATLAGLPAVVTAVGDANSSLSARVDNIGSLSVTSGSLMTGMWKKQISDDAIDESAVQHDAMKLQAVAMLNAGSEQQGRAIANVMNDESLGEMGTEQYLNKLNAARYIGNTNPYAHQLLEDATRFRKVTPVSNYQVQADVHPPVQSMEKVTTGRVTEVPESVVPKGKPKRYNRRVVQTDVERERDSDSEWEDDVEVQRPVFVRGNRRSVSRVSPVGGSFRRPGVAPADGN